jgi:Prolyl oligopeptidase family
MKRRWLASLLVASFGFCKTFTLEQVFSAPFPAAPPAVTAAANAAREDSAHTAFESSPMSAIRTWKSPVLLIQGDDDRNANFSETITPANALRQQGVYFEQLILPDEIHTFLRHASWLRGYHAAADSFKRKL